MTSVKAKRGKFFRANAELRLPIYLNADIQAYMMERAARQGMPLGEMVNALMKQEIQIIESVKYALVQGRGVLRAGQGLSSP